MTQLTRLAARRAEGSRWLLAALAGRLDTHAEAALDVAVETGDPIGQVLAGLIETSAGPALALRLTARCIERERRDSIPLREVWRSLPCSSSLRLFQMKGSWAQRG